ncbi:MAG TPA: polysaccharide biosynthesis protein [Terracidiphilus sp.]|nr:polysaccharide biosynthesis protein [Terracidiphilus sp.]
MIPELARVDWFRFLNRGPLPPPSACVLEALRRERILVTGAGGSIGGALALRLEALRPKQLVLLDAAESALFAIQNSMRRAGADATRTSFVLGTVNDAALLEDAFAEHEPNLVFHAAAFKHVPILEEQPLAAIENNIFGTASVLRAATRHGARCVLLSTDKAVQPVSVLGASKRVAEMLTLAQGAVAMRLANVMASSDSVAEVFARQITEDGAMTVTDEKARRYFLSIDEAADLLLAAAGVDSQPALLVPRLMQQHGIADLARFMAAELAPGRAVRIEFTKLRPGDKESEMLWSAGEEAVEAGGMVQLNTPIPDDEALEKGLEELKAAVRERDVAAGLDAMCALVPEYVPSAAVRRLASKDRLGAIA